MIAGFGPGTGKAALSRTIADLLALLITVASLLWAADIYRRLGLTIFNEQFLALMLGVNLALVFIIKPARGKIKTNLPWYDVIAALVGFGAAAYVGFEYPRLIDALYERPADALVVGCVLLALVLEGLRRALSPALAIVLAIFLVLGFFGHLLPGTMQGRKLSFDGLVTFLAIDSNALLGIPLMVVTTIVVPFVFFGSLLSRSGGSEFFTDISIALMGRYRGGSAKIAITASGLFGSISGSAVSNVASTGVITIPLMRQAGYRPATAGAIEAVASTGGQLMPPVMGIAAFVMAEFLQIPYSSVVLAALVPSILYYGALFMQADLLAARDGMALLLPVSGSLTNRCRL